VVEAAALLHLTAVAPDGIMGCGMSGLCPGHDNAAPLHVLDHQLPIEELLQPAPAGLRGDVVARVVDLDADQLDDPGLVRRRHLGNAFHQNSFPSYRLRSQPTTAGTLTVNASATAPTTITSSAALIIACAPRSIRDRSRRNFVLARARRASPRKSRRPD